MENWLKAAAWPSGQHIRLAIQRSLVGILIPRSLDPPKTKRLSTIPYGRDTQCDTSRRQVASSELLLRQGFALILSLRYVARIQTSLNSCDRSQRQNSLAATMIFTCHTRRFVAATCRGDVSQRFVASCVSAFNQGTCWFSLHVLCTAC